MGKHLSEVSNEELLDDIRGWRKQIKDMAPSYPVDLLNMQHLIALVKGHDEDLSKVFVYVEELARRIIEPPTSKHIKESEKL